MSLDVNSMMEALNNETIDLYKKLLGLFDEKIICKKNGLVVNNKTIIPPKLVYINDYIHKLKQEKSSLLIEYYDLYNTIIMLSPADKISQTTRDKYDKLIELINKIQTDIDHLQNYRYQLDIIDKDKIDKLHTQYKNSLLEQKNLQIEGNGIARFVKLNKNIENTLEELRLEKNKSKIDFYVEKLPQLSNVVLKDIKEKIIEKPVSPKEETKKEKKPKVTKKAEISKKISPKKLESVKSNIKELIESTLLKPKSKEECVSQKRSQPFYMSLKAILEEIEKHPELKAMLPKNYKTLPKEKLCEYLYTK